MAEDPKENEVSSQNEIPTKPLEFKPTKRRSTVTRPNRNIKEATATMRKRRAALLTLAFAITAGAVALMGDRISNGISAFIGSTNETATIPPETFTVTPEDVATLEDILPSLTPTGIPSFTAPPPSLTPPPTLELTDTPTKEKNAPTVSPTNPESGDDPDDLEKLMSQIRKEPDRGQCVGNGPNDYTTTFDERGFFIVKVKAKSTNTPDSSSVIQVKVPLSQAQDGIQQQCWYGVEQTEVDGTHTYTYVIPAEKHTNNVHKTFWTSAAKILNRARDTIVLSKGYSIVNENGQMFSNDFTKGVEDPTPQGEYEVLRYDEPTN